MSFARFAPTVADGAPSAAMKPNLEQLESRIVPSQADLIAFQQQLPALTAEFTALVPVAQQQLQTDLNSVAGIVVTLPEKVQQATAPVLAESQAFVNAFPSLAAAWLQQEVANEEALLLAQNDAPSPQDGGQVQQTNTVYYQQPIQPLPPIQPIPQPQPPQPPQPPEPEPTDPTTGSMGSSAAPGMGLFTASPSLSVAPLAPQVVLINTDPSVAAYLTQGVQDYVSGAPGQPSYLTLLASYYGITSGTVIDSVVKPPVPGNAPTEAQIEQYLTGLIQSGQVPAPTPTTIYIINGAPGQVDGDAWAGTAIGGYNDVLAVNGRNVSFGFVYDLVPTANAASANFHEVTEAAAGWTSGIKGRDIDDELMWNPEYAYLIGSNPSYTFYAAIDPSGNPIIYPYSQPQQPPQQQQIQTQQSIQSVLQQQQAAQIAVFEDLAAVAVEQFDALALRWLSFYDPHDFASSAATAQQQLASNPLTNTPQGQQAAAIGDILFTQALQKTA